MNIYFYLFITSLNILSSDSVSIGGRNHKNDLVPHLSSRLEGSSRKDANSLKILSNEPFVIQLQVPPNHDGGKEEKGKEKKRRRLSKKRFPKLKSLRKKHRFRRDVQNPIVQTVSGSQGRKISRPEKILRVEPTKPKNSTNHHYDIKTSDRQKELLKIFTQILQKEKSINKSKELKSLKKGEGKNSLEKLKLDNSNRNAQRHHIPETDRPVRVVYPTAPKTEQQTSPKYTYRDLKADQERVEDKIKYLTNLLNLNDSLTEDGPRVRRKTDSDRVANKLAKMFLTLSAVNGMHEKRKSKCGEEENDEDDVWTQEKRNDQSKKNHSSNEERYKVKKWIEHMKNRRTSHTCPCMNQDYSEENDVFPLEQKLSKDYPQLNEDKSSEEVSSESYRERNSFFYPSSRPGKNSFYRQRYSKAYDDLDKKLMAFTKRGRRKLELPMEDLEVYRSRAKQILQNAEDILDKIKEQEEKRQPNVLLSQLRELTSRIQSDPRKSENDLMRLIQKNFGWEPQGKAQDVNSLTDNIKSFLIDPYEKAKALTDESTRKLSTYLLKNFGKLDVSDDGDAATGEEDSKDDVQIYQGQEPKVKDETLYSSNLQKENDKELGEVSVSETVKPDNGSVSYFGGEKTDGVPDYAIQAPVKKRIEEMLREQGEKIKSYTESPELSEDAEEQEKVAAVSEGVVDGDPIATEGARVTEKDSGETTTATDEYRSSKDEVQKENPGFHPQTEEETFETVKESDLKNLKESTIEPKENEREVKERVGDALNQSGKSDNKSIEDQDVMHPEKNPEVQSTPDMSEPKNMEIIEKSFKKSDELNEATETEDTSNEDKTPDGQREGPENEEVGVVQSPAEDPTESVSEEKLNKLIKTLEQKLEDGELEDKVEALKTSVKDEYSKKEDEPAEVEEVLKLGDPEEDSDDKENKDLVEKAEDLLKIGELLEKLADETEPEENKNFNGDENGESSLRAENPGEQMYNQENSDEDRKDEERTADPVDELVKKEENVNEDEESSFPEENSTKNQVEDEAPGNSNENDDETLRSTNLDDPTEDNFNEHGKEETLLEAAKKDEDFQDSDVKNDQGMETASVKINSAEEFNRETDDSVKAETPLGSEDLVPEDDDSVKAETPLGSEDLVPEAEDDSLNGELPLGSEDLVREAEDDLVNAETPLGSEDLVREAEDDLVTAETPLGSEDLVQEAEDDLVNAETPLGSEDLVQEAKDDLVNAETPLGSEDLVQEAEEDLVNAETPLGSEDLVQEAEDDSVKLETPLGSEDLIREAEDDSVNPESPLGSETEAEFENTDPDDETSLRSEPVGEEEGEGVNKEDETPMRSAHPGQELEAEDEVSGADEQALTRSEHSTKIEEETDQDDETPLRSTHPGEESQAEDENNNYDDGTAHTDTGIKAKEEEDENKNEETSLRAKNPNEGNQETEGGGEDTLRERDPSDQGDENLENGEEISLRSANWNAENQVTEEGEDKKNNDVATVLENEEDDLATAPRGADVPLDIEYTSGEDEAFINLDSVYSEAERAIDREILAEVYGGRKSMLSYPFDNPSRAANSIVSEPKGTPKFSIPKTIGVIMKGLEGKDKGDLPIGELGKEQIDHYLDKIDEAEQSIKEKTEEEDCRKECACAEDLKLRSQNLGKYEIVKDFLYWMKNLQLN